MANPRKVWGQSRIKIDGRVIETEGKSSIEIGGIARDAVEADHAAGHFSEKTVPSKIECSVLITGGVSLRELQNIDDATVTMEADTGQTYVVSHAYTAEGISAGEGKAKLILMGPPAEEMAS